MLIKKLNIWLFLIISFLLIVFPVSGLTYSDIALTSGNNFFEQGDYAQAIIEYKRFAYFNPESEYIDDIYYKTGLAYRNIENWDKAIEYFEKAIQDTKDKSRSEEIKITIASTLIAEGNFSKAEIILLKLKAFSEFNEIKKEASFFLGINYLYNYQWDKSYNEFKEYFDSNSELKKLHENIKKAKYKSPKLAKILSIIIPGAGQIYCHNFWDGMNALIINSACGYFFVNDLLNKNYDYAAINLIFLFKRFYMGNLKNAERLAKNYNTKLNDNNLKTSIDKINKLANRHYK